MTCSAACPCEPKTFRFLQVLQRGDLPIYIYDEDGPVVPARVNYALFFIYPTGARQLVGPAQRTPSAGEIGEFYATGRAGESSQPGCWVIRWEFQRTLQEGVQTREMTFRVFDAVLAADPHDTLARCRKYGWN